MSSPTIAERLGPRPDPASLTQPGLVDQATQSLGLLVPVRQFGAERLDPVRVIHLTEGYEADNKTNPVEADAIVDQIRKCLAEPRPPPKRPSIFRD